MIPTILVLFAVLFILLARVIGGRKHFLKLSKSYQVTYVVCCTGIIWIESVFFGLVFGIISGAIVLCYMIGKENRVAKR